MKHSDESTTAEELGLTAEQIHEKVDVDLCNEMLKLFAGKETGVVLASIAHTLGQSLAKVIGDEQSACYAARQYEEYLHAAVHMAFFHGEKATAPSTETTQ